MTRPICTRITSVPKFPIARMVPMKPAKPFNDSDVRKAAHEKLLRHAKERDDTIVIDELGLHNGACRVDIAVVNGHIRGIEIKAEADNLDRLASQVSAYGTVVDTATLIVAKRHLHEALKALPEWWGVIVAARCANQSIRFSRLRSERVNRHVEPLRLLRLIWRAEAVELLATLKPELNASNWNRDALYTEIARSLPKTRLRGEVRRILKARGNWRDRRQSSLYDGSYPPNAM